MLGQKNYSFTEHQMKMLCDQIRQLEELYNKWEWNHKVDITEIKTHLKIIKDWLDFDNLMKSKD